MDPEVLVMAKRLAESDNPAMMRLGQEIFFGSNPTYVEYITFRKGFDSVKPWKEEVFLDYMRRNYSQKGEK